MLPTQPVLSKTSARTASCESPVSAKAESKALLWESEWAECSQRVSTAEVSKGPVWSAVMIGVWCSWGDAGTGGSTAGTR